jgi:deoxycytidylate deaminase
VHAEINALLQCHRLDLAHKLYVTCAPCRACALVLCNTPIRKIVCTEPYADVVGVELLARSGIQLTIATV